MTKDPSRKKPKRRPVVESQEAIDHAALMAVLLENKLSNNAQGWFELPWRSGWNAAGLCLAISDRTTKFNLDDVAISTALRGWILMRASGGLIYERAESMRLLAKNASLSMALRCLQLEIASSSGGGHVYNDLLKILFQDLEESQYHFEGLVLDARCRDAIGVAVQLQNDENDRFRRAFKIAWSGGLYHAAYAIGPLSKRKI